MAPTIISSAFIVHFVKMVMAIWLLHVSGLHLYSTSRLYEDQSMSDNESLFSFDFTCDTNYRFGRITTGRYVFYKSHDKMHKYDLNACCFF